MAMLIVAMWLIEASSLSQQRRIKETENAAQNENVERHF